MSQVKTVTRDEVKEHKSRDSVWFVIDDKVYDVTKFMDEHPGGEEVLLEQAGKDASEIFEDVGHSADAKELMRLYLVGELPEHERSKDEKAKKDVKDYSKKKFDDGTTAKSLTWAQWAMTLAVSCGVGFLVRNWISN